MYPRRPGGPGSPPPPPVPRKPKIVFQPQVSHGIMVGVDLIANALRPTLGPLPRLVGIERAVHQSSPEILDDGGTIARRIIQVKGRDKDTGAMLLRHLAWRMHQTVGDGSVTMAVIFQSIIHEGLRYIITQGGNPMLLRLGLERYAGVISTAIHENSQLFEEDEGIPEMAKGLCQGDDELAKILSEVMDIVGKDGTVEVRKGSRIGVDREYIEGTYWSSSGWFSSIFQTDIEKHRVLVENASILISDFRISSASQFIPLLEMAVKAKIQNLIVVCFEIPDEAIGLFIKNAKSKTINVIPVRTPRLIESDRMSALEDIAVLTGGAALHDAAGETINDVTIDKLGQARIAWANDTYFGVIGGKGDPRAARVYINQLKEMVKDVDGNQKDQMQKRIGRLVGGTAILNVGGKTESEITHRTTVAERAVLALRNAMEGGVVLGGGAGLLQCQSALCSTDQDKNEEDKAARRILSRALEEPLRVIAKNSGYVPDTIVDKVKDSPEGFGFDAITGKIVDLRKAGILDALNVIEKALQVAVSGAGMALTTDVIIHRKYPPEIMEP